MEIPSIQDRNARISNRGNFSIQEVFGIGSKSLAIAGLSFFHSLGHPHFIVTPLPAALKGFGFLGGAFYLCIIRCA